MKTLLKYQVKNSFSFIWFLVISQILLGICFFFPPWSLSSLQESLSCSTVSLEENGIYLVVQKHFLSLRCEQWWPGTVQPPGPSGTQKRIPPQKGAEKTLKK